MKTILLILIILLTSTNIYADEFNIETAVKMAKLTLPVQLNETMKIVGAEAVDNDFWYTVEIDTKDRSLDKEMLKKYGQALNAELVSQQVKDACKTPWMRILLSQNSAMGFKYVTEKGKFLTLILVTPGDCLKIVE